MALEVLIRAREQELEQVRLETARLAERFRAGRGSARPEEVVGLTDEAIAHQLDWHPRTVQRHVRRLMTELGAQTRFQLGLQATRRGWL